MALIVENGTGMATAESYASVAEANAYFSARANETWDDIEDKEAALRKATDYIEQAYYGRWKGYRKTSTQRLSWPRYSVPVEDDAAWLTLVSDSIVPERVKMATIELALGTATGDLAPAQEQGQSAVTVGPITVNYDSSSPRSTQRPAVDMLLSPFLKGSSIAVGLVRT
jgi:hypothetical protein